MEDSKRGNLVLTLKKGEGLLISDGVQTIEISFFDKFKQPINVRARIKSSKTYDVKRKMLGGIDEEDDCNDVHSKGRAP